MCKVEKSNRKKSRPETEDRGAGVARSSRPFNMRCYCCNRRGHIKANCPDRTEVRSKQTVSQIRQVDCVRSH